jgi:hypothetical protein
MQDLNSRAGSYSPALDALVNQGRKRKYTRSSAIRDEIHVCETKFWAGNQLDSNGRRTSKPRTRDLAPDYDLYGKAARVTGSKLKWLRDMDRGL